MSRAGVDSSIGDEYQDLIVAFWAVKMLGNKEILRIEVDSTSISPSGFPFSVDNVVIFYANKEITCSQCKKNQSEFRSWTVADLADDLRKAWRQWRELPNSRIIFYSRSNFGELAKLQERARKRPNSSAFLYDMPKSEKTIDFSKQSC